MEPEQTIPAYGLPCEQCGQPAHHTEVYPRGRRVIHTDRRIHPCTLYGRTRTPERTR